MPEEANAARSIYFHASGRVQGVGFRYFTQQEAERLQVTGWVRNRADGTVEGEARGTAAAIEAFVEAVRRGPRHGRVDHLNIEERDQETDGDRFEIRYWA